MRRNACTEYLKYDFTTSEANENAKLLARRTRALAEHELKKKQMVDDLKTEEEGLKADIAQFSRFVTDGYDFRMIECRIIFDDPKPGAKTIYRTDTGEAVKTEKMTDDEKQAELPLDN